MNLNSPFGSRQPNNYEYFYTDIASTVGNPRLCAKISSKALVENGPDFGSTKWSVYTQRSECYFYAAVLAKDPNLCRKVGRIYTIPSNDSEISASECRKAAANSRGFAGRLFPGGGYLIDAMMKEMKFTDEDYYSVEYAENSRDNSIYRFLETVRNTEEFQSKVLGLPNYDEPISHTKFREANADEMLTQMLAVQKLRPDLCRKISPNSLAVGPNGMRQYVPLRIALRDDCFYNVAQTMRSAAPCKEIPSANNYGNGIYISTRERCEGQLKTQRMDKQWVGTYGPEQFPDMAHFADAMRKLGYPKPFLTDGHPVNWNRFIMHLEFGAPDKIKEDFLKRTNDLPSFN